MRKLTAQAEPSHEDPSLKLTEIAAPLKAGVELTSWRVIVGNDAPYWRYRHVKRGIDMVGGLVLLVLSIVPGLIIALIIMVTSKGPVFYREERVGRGGRPFRIWKFRSMHHPARTAKLTKAGPSEGTILQWRVHKSTRDMRITKFGGFLRRWSLDELPQVLNVLRGDMSLVGPRPVVKAEVPLYGPLQHYYFACTPGISGLWQVSGRSNLGFILRANLDSYYVRNWSLRTDFLILIQTIPAVISRVGAR